ncbi:hypothetical protein D3C76_1071960 [compost metagenome]
MQRQQLIALIGIGIGLGAEVVAEQLVGAHRRVDQGRAAAIQLTDSGRHEAAEGAAHGAESQPLAMTGDGLLYGLLYGRPGRRRGVGLGRDQQLDIGPVPGDPGRHLLRLGRTGR